MGLMNRFCLGRKPCLVYLTPTMLEPDAEAHGASPRPPGTTTTATHGMPITGKPPFVTSSRIASIIKARPRVTAPSKRFRPHEIPCLAGWYNMDGARHALREWTQAGEATSQRGRPARAVHMLAALFP